MLRGICAGSVTGPMGEVMIRRKVCASCNVLQPVFYFPDGRFVDWDGILFQFLIKYNRI